MRVEKAKQGFTLAEVMLGVGILAVAILTLLVLLVSLTQSSSKSADLTISEMAADQILTRVVYSRDAANHASFWNPSSPLSIPGTWTDNRIEFTYTLDITAVLYAPDGTRLGTSSGLTNNRLKLAVVTLRWHDDASGNRAGYGQLHAEVSRILREHPP